MKMTFGPVPTTKPALLASRIAAKTISEMPSISNPTCVTQLKKDTSRLPVGPNGARLIPKAVVPAAGPCRLASPVRKYDRLPIRTTRTAWAKDSLNTTMAIAP